MGDATTVLRGTVEQVVFTNPDTGWTVLRLARPDEVQPTTVVGVLPTTTTGTELEVTGQWTHNAKYGRQFRAETAMAVTPDTAVGIQRYLASGLVDGLGAGLAERLVNVFGSETLSVIETSPERLTEVDGIGPVRADKIRQALSAHLGLQSTMVFLHGLGLSSGLAGRIQRRYGAQTVRVVQENPFRLALDVRGIGFSTADRIASHLGIAPDSPHRAQAALLHILAQSAQDGHVYLPKSALFQEATQMLGRQATLEDATAALRQQEYIICDEQTERIYATPMYEAEIAVASRLLDLSSVAPSPLVDDAKEVIATFEATHPLALAEQQRQAVETANHARILIITGGPGTGKTTLIKALLHLFQQAKLRIQLAAPTGRAAQRMTDATGLEAKTLHRLLAYDPGQNIFMHHHEHPLPAEALVVDEVSMLDLPLMAALTAALPDRVRLVLVGDVDQLPSVGPGQILKDLIESDQLPIVRLNQVFRQQSGSRIVENAHRINRGESPDFTRTDGGLSDFYLIERSDPVAAAQTLETVVAERIPASFGINAPDDIQVLTPMHKGELGAQALNERLQQRLNPDGPSITRGPHTFRLGDKVMQTKNNYDLGVFNGDIGRLVFVDPRKQRLKVAFDSREVAYEAEQQDALTLAYAMSIHKSQGSEYPAVVIALSMQHYVMLYRNLLYTAVTRGKRLVVLIGEARALRTAVSRARDQARYTGLAERLRRTVGDEHEGEQ